MATRTKSPVKKAARRIGATAAEGLQIVPRTLAELPIMLMGRLYFRPQVLSRTLTKSLARKHAKSEESTYRLLRDEVWPAEEIVVHKALEGVLMGAPPNAVAKAINNVAPGAHLAAPCVCKLRIPNTLNEIVGEPDVVLWDEGASALVLVELKIGAKPSNGRYSLGQLMKYMMLGLLARSTLGIKHVSHLIVLPSRNIRDHCVDADNWEPSVAADGQLIVPRAWQSPTYITDYSLLAQRDAMSLKGFDNAEFGDLLDESRPLLQVHTYVTSWQLLCKELDHACAAAKAGHLAPSFVYLRRLGEGKAASGKS